MGTFMFEMGLQEPNYKHGVDIQKGNKAIGDYITQWELSDEITRANVKVGRGESLTYFDFLHLIQQGIEVEKYSYLVQIYDEATFGINQLVYSRGLKEALHMFAISDEEIIEQEQQREGKLFYEDSFPFWSWRGIREYDLPTIKILAQNGEFEAMQKVIEDSEKRYRESPAGIRYAQKLLTTK
jgi:hypothetical protein